MPSMSGFRRLALLALPCIAILPPSIVRGAEAPRGALIYRRHCERCHGVDGAGTADVPAPLAGERSVGQLAALVDETMPQDDPAAIGAEEAGEVAAWIHEAFYSPLARSRMAPARVEVSRLTVRQHRAAVADLVSGFLGAPARTDGPSGLDGEYFHGRSFDGATRVFRRVDPVVSFDFGVEGPDPERFEPGRFAIRWRGSIVPDETGVHEFVVRTAHAVRLLVNALEGDEPLVDAWVVSGDAKEHRGSIHLLAGRAHPLLLEFSKASQGVDDRRHERPRQAGVELLWRPPHGVLETVPARNLLAARSQPTHVIATPFPPDDTSAGHERGVGVSREWLEAVESAATETAVSVREHVDVLSRVAVDAPDRAERLREFAAAFAERAFRRPLDEAARAAYVDGPFAASPDAAVAVERAVLAVLSSPRFLFREPFPATGAAADPWDTAARLSFGLWDSLPDEALRDAARQGSLSTVEEVERHARRMLEDPRARRKVHEFLLAWLRVAQPTEIVKDPLLHPGFGPEIAVDLRRSLELFLRDVAFPAPPAGEDPSAPAPRADYRRLFTAEEVWINGRVATLFGVDLPPGADFRPVRLDGGSRAGVLTHPYLLSVLAYPGGSSPIHRGVFLTRSVLGNVLRPPVEAVAPLAPDLHPGLTTRQRVEVQTGPASCQVCHGVINPLGFTLESYDAVGRRRATDGASPVDDSGAYVPRFGDPVTFRGARDLGRWIAVSRDAEEAFLRALFHALVKQPAAAWGPDVAERIRASFSARGCDIREAVVDIMKVAAFPPAAPARTGGQTP